MQQLRAQVRWFVPVIMCDTQRDEELRPVPKERAVLESFFTQLGMFWFDRAKDYVEKEKDASKSAGAIWGSLLAALAHLAAAEKAYHNMTFLGQKLGMREALLILYSYSLHKKILWCYPGVGRDFWNPISTT